MSIKDPYVCTVCGLKFSGFEIFERHRVGEYVDEHPDYGRSCREDDELRARGYNRVRGVWSATTEEKHAEMEDAARQRLFRGKKPFQPLSRVRT